MKYVYILTGVNFTLAEKIHTANFMMSDTIKDIEDFINEVNPSFLTECGMFTYFVIEKYELGEIHPFAKEINWYRENNGKIIEWGRPNIFEHICNFGMS